jgi:hypothetical protein
MIRASSFFLATIAPVVLTIAGTARAQDEPPTVVPIVVRPAAAPVPALTYRILPEHSALVPGNAAIFYHRAIEMILEQRRSTPSVRRNSSDEVVNEEMVTQWISGPLGAIPLDRARRWLERNRGALHEAELGARRQSCDWEFDSRAEGFVLVISEIQEMRSLARLVTLRARVAVVENRLDEAVSWLQTGCAMARHVSQGPILVQALVSVHLSAIQTKLLEDLIQAPGLPSLFWALANRPHPLIDLSPALEGERFLLEREFPQLRELDGVPWSVEKARQFADAIQTRMFRYAGMGVWDRSGTGSRGLKDWSLQLGVAAMVAQAYPEAKRALIAQGRNPAQVEAMPTVQVAALHTYQSFQAYRDDIFKWAGLPCLQAFKGTEAAWQRCHADMQSRPLLKLFLSLLGSTHWSYLAAARVDRQLDAIACIEAIRIYAQAHQGLPARLEEIAEAPVPIDPLTGLPFEYRLEGDRATLSAPYPPGVPRVPGYSFQYELKLAR